MLQLLQRRHPQLSGDVRITSYNVCYTKLLRGIEIHNDEILDLLADQGARIDRNKNQVMFSDELIDKSLASAPATFKWYDIYGNETHHFAGDQVYFTPGSAALNILDYGAGQVRKPVTDRNNFV